MSKYLTVQEILNVTGGKLLYGNEEEQCKSFSRNTKEINNGDIYVGFKGEKNDGSKFYMEAFEQGAKGCIINKIEGLNPNKIEGKFIIEVKDTVDAIGKMAALKREKYNIPVIAITGSVGKTSTKDAVASVVSEKYKTLKTKGNMNNHIGMPMTILKLKDEEALVVEMGMNHFGEISKLTNIAKPTVAIITNVGTAHIGNLGSRENILKAKLEILEGATNPTIIINNDNDLLHKWYEENKEKYNIKTYGIKEESDLNANNIKLESEKSFFDCGIRGIKENIEVPVGGEHFILNSLCAILAGETLNIENKEIVEGIEEFELTKNRMDIYNLENGIKIINGAYNASFEAMQATLKSLGEFKENRKIAVLGDMYELGEFTKDLHEKVGVEAYNDKVDILICSRRICETYSRRSKKIRI